MGFQALLTGSPELLALRGTDHGRASPSPRLLPEPGLSGLQVLSDLGLPDFCPFLQSFRKILKEIAHFFPALGFLSFCYCDQTLTKIYIYVSRTFTSLTRTVSK